MASQVSDVEELRNKMKQADDLEAQLESLPKKFSEERSPRLRMQLCEILSDVMLQDPYFALRKNCADRLWRSCFYGRITQLRNRINREKRKKGPNLKNLESSLNVFLQEAIVLYRWIVNKYETKLLPRLPDSQLSQESETSAIAPTEDVTGVIPILYRLLIHLGDLNRYAGSFNDASTSYTEASKLAPGKGNPYNQLAVVAQMKDPSSPLSCVSLYWYTRSLLAVDGPFETSKSNLALLFDHNQKWLEKHAEDPVIQATGTNRKALQQQARAQKSALSQRFLSRFVNLHYDFFQAADRKDISKADLTSKVQDVLERFSSLLDATAFGDALLMKMVAINAFSTHNLNSGSDCFEQAMALLLSFGASMLQRVEKTLQKVVPATEQPSPAAMPSVRLVVPLVLICDYLYTFHDRHLVFENHPHDDLWRDASQSFWCGVASVANLLSTVRDQLNPSSLQHLQIKEFESFVGYVPFQPFVCKGKKHEAFVSADEAVRALELSPPTTQESSASVSPGNDEENRLKLVRFLQVVDRFVRRWEKGGNGLLARVKDGVYKATAHPHDTGMGTSEVTGQETNFDNEEDMDTTVTVEASAQQDGNDEDDGGDVVMYKPTEGAGPALLVPGPLLTKEVKAAPVVSKAETPATDPWKTTVNESVGVDMSSLLAASPAPPPPPVEAHEAPHPAASKQPLPVSNPVEVAAIPPPPGLLPPPGFGGTVASSGAASLSSSTAVPTAPPPPGFSQQSVPTQQNIHTHGLDLSNLSTANPFASEYPQPSLESLRLPGSGIFGSGYGESKPSSNFLDVNREKEASLVESSFLTNLWAEESQKTDPPYSENPFLT